MVINHSNMIVWANFDLIMHAVHFNAVISMLSESLDMYLVDSTMNTVFFQFMYRSEVKLLRLSSALCLVFSVFTFAGASIWYGWYAF